jgi:hypothetical protein
VKYGMRRAPLRVSGIHRLLLLLIPALTIGTSNAGTETQRNKIRQKLSGTWQLNLDLSSDGRSELPGNLDSPNRISLIRSTDLWAQVEAEPLTAELLEASELLEILRHGKELTINAIGSPDIVLTRTVYTDGRLSEQSFGSGNSGISRARWDDERLIIETETTGALRVTETYELNANGSLLAVSVQIENPLWSQPLFIHRVYDRIR